MSLTSHGRRSALALVPLTVLSAGCSAFNKVDVCDQPWAAPVTVNRGLEGMQKTGTPGAMVPLPGGNALVVFASEVGERDPTDATELRSVRLTAEGSPLPSCERNDSRDDLLVRVDLTDPRKQL